MKKSLWLLWCFLISGITNAQIFDPVKWSYKAIPGADGEYTLQWTADIEDGWYVYSQFIAEGGPIPTSFTFDKNEQVKLLGKVSEKGDKTKEGFDEMFNMNIKKFAHRAVFEQKVKVSAGTVLSGSLDFMTCNDERCLPPDNRAFSFSLTKGGSDKATEESKVSPVTETEAPSVINAAPSGNGMLDPVKWTMNSSSGNGKIRVQFKAEIAPGWHTYSQFVKEGGPIPTSIVLEDTTAARLLGPAKESGSKLEESFQEVFGMKVKSFANDALLEQEIQVLQPKGKVHGYLEYMACDDSRCLPPATVGFTLNLEDGSIVADAAPVGAGEAVTDERFGAPLTDCGVAQEAGTENSIWSIMLLGFLGGLLALLTPCVFPMIPLTVSFFTKRSPNPRKGKIDALIYTFSIILIYFLLAVPFLIFDISPDTLNEISTGVPLNIFFFVIFVVFAFSFFGYYEITLPNFIANRAESASDVGGLIGIFFMAVTLAIVSFSCTGPILGTLLVGALSSSGGKLNLVAGMTAFGTALALPFGLFALFPGWLKSLPRSGGWLNTVKVVLGFIELILAIKFLSNADLVAHWGVLKREVFLGLWAVLSVATALYLFGLIRFPHDNEGEKPGWVRRGLGVVAMVFAAYCSWGVSGADLHLLSGFPPPKFYSVVKQETHCPHNLNCFHDYDEALAYAKQQNKPLMIDFTGWACVNCRKMEENVWIHPEVYRKLNEDFVLVSLYVDDTKALPESEQYVSPFSGKKIKTLGNKWSDMQATYFKNNSQPYYVLVSPDEKLLNNPVGYTPDIQEYLSFLDCGIKAYAAEAKH